MFCFVIVRQEWSNNGKFALLYKTQDSKHEANERREFIGGKQDCKRRGVRCNAKIFSFPIPSHPELWAGPLFFLSGLGWCGSSLQVLNYKQDSLCQRFSLVSNQHQRNDRYLPSKQAMINRKICQYTIYTKPTMRQQSKPYSPHTIRTDSEPIQTSKRMGFMQGK